MSERLTVCSEIFIENEQINNELSHCPNIVDSVTHFKLKIKNAASEILRSDYDKLNVDGDGDLVLQRKPVECIIKIEHSKRTIIDLVGLQVWRGALLLADFVSHFGHSIFCAKNVLELGCGVGLTSIVAAFYSKHVICSDIDAEDILNTVKNNINNNRHFIKSDIQIEKIDFLQRNFSDHLEQLFDIVDIILAADVIYDNDVTDGFIQTLIDITRNRPSKIIYISLEKRYVFTIEHLDTVAPCYEHFIQRLQTTNDEFSLQWKIEQLSLDFPQYFDYIRSKELVLLKITT